MLSAEKRADPSSDPLPLFFRFTLGFAIAAFVFAALALPATVLFAWIVHFRRLPDWLVNGLGVLVALGVVFCVWQTIRLLSRRRYRFSLRSAMILTTMAAVSLSIVGHQLRLAEEKRRAVQALWKDGSGAQYYLKAAEDSTWFCWLIRRFGHDPFANVTEISVRTDHSVQTLLDHQAQFADLEVVRFGTGVSDQGLQRAREFNRFSKLQFADFRESSLTDAGIKQLSSWTNLSTLGLYGCNRITDAGLAQLAEMPALESIVFISEGNATTTITDAGLVHVGKMNHLNGLFILGLPITDTGLDYLKGIDDLRVLRVYRTQVTKRGIEELQRALPRCEIFSDVK